MRLGTPSVHAGAFGVLRFSIPDDVAGDLKIATQTLFVRSCYPLLLERVMAQPKPRFFMSGNSGIGKSWFLYYLMHHILVELRIPVVFSSILCPELIWIPVDGDIEAYDDRRHRRHAVNHWWVFDGVEPPDGYLSPIVIAGSPGVSEQWPLIKQSLKEDILKELYMPVWSLEELEQCASLYPNPAEKLVVLPKLFSMWGGIPRYVLQFAENAGKTNGLDDPEKVLNSAILQFKTGLVDIIATGLRDVRQLEVSYKLVHYVVDDQFTAVGVRFGSRYISNCLVESRFRDDRGKLVSFLRASAGESQLAGLRGDLFESFSHSALRNGGQFQRRALATGTVAPSDPLVLQANTGKTFHGLHELACFRTQPIADYGVYFMPSYRNLASVDAFVRLPDRLVLFQMTVSPHHPVKHKGLQQLLDAMGPAPPSIELYFVVPPDRFATMTTQSYGAADATERNPTTVSQLDPRVSAIRQFALLIPLEQPTTPVSHG